MFYQRDWFMRQIEIMVRAIAHIFFGKEQISYEIVQPDALTESDLLYQRVLQLLLEKRVNDAEDALFVSMQPGNVQHLKIALDFYARVNAWPEEELNRCGFSHTEIQEGLTEIANRFGVTIPC